MAKEFKVRWEVGDGYAGKSRPQSFQISADDLNADMTVDDIRKMLIDITQEQFEQTVCWYLNNDDEFLEWAQERIAAMKAEE